MRTRTRTRMRRAIQFGDSRCWLDQQQREEEERRNERSYYACYPSDEDQRIIPSEEISPNDAVGEGEQAKRIKLSDSSSPTSPASAGHEFNSAQQDNKEQDEFQATCFDFNLLISDPSVSLRHDSSPQEILNLIKKDNALPTLPTESAVRLIERKIHFRSCLLNIQAEYHTVKLLYEHVSSLPYGRTFNHVRDMVDCKSPPFAHLKVDDLFTPLKIYDDLLACTEGFFHPLIRKSYKDEFFSFVDTLAKLEERDFIMRKWRKYCALMKGGPMLKLSVRHGLDDEEYDRCCRQIRL